MIQMTGVRTFFMTDLSNTVTGIESFLLDGNNMAFGQPLLANWLRMRKCGFRLT